MMATLCDPTFNEWLIKEMELEMQRLNVPLDEVQRWLTSTEVPSDPRKKTLYECVCTYYHLLFRGPHGIVPKSLGQSASTLHSAPHLNINPMSLPGIAHHLESRGQTQLSGARSMRTSSGGTMTTSTTSVSDAASSATPPIATLPPVVPALSPFSAESSSTPSSMKPELKLKPEHLGGALPPMMMPPHSHSHSHSHSHAHSASDFFPHFNINTYAPLLPSSPSSASASSSGSGSSSCCSLLSLSAQSSCSSNASNYTMPSVPSMPHSSAPSMNSINSINGQMHSANAPPAAFASMPSLLHLPPLDIEMYDVDRSRDDENKDKIQKMKEQERKEESTPSLVYGRNINGAVSMNMKMSKSDSVPPAIVGIATSSKFANISQSVPPVTALTATAMRSNVAAERERNFRCKMKNGNKIKIKAETPQHHQIRTTLERVERMGITKMRSNINMNMTMDRNHNVNDSKDTKELQDCKMKECKAARMSTASVTMTGPDGATIIESANSSPSPCPETIACRGGGGIIKTNKSYLRLISRQDEEGKMETLKWHGVSLAHCFVKRTDTVVKRDPETGKEFTEVIVAQGHKCMTLNCKYPHLYSQKCHWKRHALTEHCNRKFSCKFCGATFRQQTQRKEHIINKHTVRMVKWQCPYGCGGVFSQFRGVVRHVKLDRKCAARGKHFEEEEIEALKSGWNNILMKEMLKFETKMLQECKMVSEEMKQDIRAKTKKLYQGSIAGDRGGGRTRRRKEKEEDEGGEEEEEEEEEEGEEGDDDDEAEDEDQDDAVE